MPQTPIYKSRESAAKHGKKTKTSGRMFADVEGFSIEVADYFHERGNLMFSTKIKKGEMIDENQPGSIGCSDFR
ncbi:hypothetical protein BVN1_04500 [Bacillus velezensis]|nr:hypothetical protein BVN1_04500 [Bacillus velezensis]